MAGPVRLRRPRPVGDLDRPGFGATRCRSHPGPPGGDSNRTRPGPVLRRLRLHFLGAATTVTGSQYLLETDRARVLIDCGMFQGPPDVGARNQVPLGYDPTTIDALLL